jgi:TatD DNase family protein
VIDTHAHLTSLPDPDQAIDEALEAGLDRRVTIGQGPADARAALALSGAHPEVRVVAGLHPHRAAEWSAEVERELDALLADPRVVGVGECGLDYYRDRAPRAAQAAAFEGQLRLAERHGLPAVIHTREAADDTLATLRGARCRVVLHCFSLPDRLDEALERGYWCSFAGNVTYPKAVDLQEAARRVPADRLLVETDCPYLAPVPHRGRPNRPAYVLDTLRFVAGLRGEDPGALGERVVANAERAFAFGR